mmetsp:Transcript_10439/g.19510  ORF Transcript_10439/g.19510 Transcript_10439/m.19510 type:complete len:258 (-) Transcript_10439:799-1572(-)
MSLLAEARIATDAFNQVAVNIAQQVSELQSLCLLGSSHSPAEMRRVREKIDEMEERLGHLEYKVVQETIVVEQVDNLLEQCKCQRTQARELAELYGKNEQVIGEGSPADNAVETEEEEVDFSDQEELEEPSNSLEVQVPSPTKFSKVPQYMRGRLSRSKLAGAVEAVNAAIKHKRDTMAIPRSKQSMPVRKEILRWKDQELEETRDLFFVSSEDIFTQSSNLGVEPGTMKTSLQVLRYCNAFKQISQAGVSRYCLPK